MTQKLTKTNAIGAEQSDVLVVGCGYLGKVVARLAQCGGAKVTVTTRSRLNAADFDRQGWTPELCDWTNRSSLGFLRDRFESSDPRVLIAVSYDRHSNQSRHESQVGGLRNLLGVLPPRAKICYISTTGVYHQMGGAWVDENSPTRPTRLGGRVHLEAETLFRRHRPSSPWMILRLAGIYGPRRVPRVADVLQGRPIASTEHGFLNLIHVQDAARAVMASWSTMEAQCDTGHHESWHPTLSRRLYVVSDDQPVIRGEFYREVARQAGVKAPQFVSPSPESPASMRSESNKRVWNRRMKHQLLRDLDFPDYRIGLANLIAG